MEIEIGLSFGGGDLKGLMDECFYSLYVVVMQERDVLLKNNIFLNRQISKKKKNII